MGAKNVRGNVKSLACWSVCLRPSARAQVGSSEPEEPVWHPSAADGRVLGGLTNGFLVSTMSVSVRLSSVSGLAARCSVCCVLVLSEKEALNAETKS